MLSLNHISSEPLYGSRHLCRAITRWYLCRIPCILTTYKLATVVLSFAKRNQSSWTLRVSAWEKWNHPLHKHLQTPTLSPLSIPNLKTRLHSGQASCGTSDSCEDSGIPPLHPQLLWFNTSLVASILDLSFGSCLVIVEL